MQQDDVRVLVGGYESGSTAHSAQKRPWDSALRSPPHPLHSMMARAGAFPPAMAAHFIREFTNDGDLVLDPFCGKGTSVLEAVLAGRSAIGSDIAPDAVACTRAKVAGVSLADVDDYIETLRYRRYSLLRVPADVGVFYHDITLSRMLCVRDRLLSDMGSEDDPTRRLASFIMGCLLGILHGHATYSLSLSCSHVFAMAPNYVKKYAAEKKLQRPKRDVRQCLRAKAKLVLSGPDIQSGRAAVHLTSADRYAYDDGRLTNQVALILTSPPYLNAQTYAKDAWLRLWLLGHDYRRLRPSYLQTSSVNRYRELIAPCLAEMGRVLRPGGHCVLVAGDVFVKRRNARVAVRTADILAEVAEELQPTNGFRLRAESLIEDRIPSHARCYSAVHKDANSHWDEEGNGTGVRVDRVLVVRKVSA